MILSTSAIAQPFYKSYKIEQRYLETIKIYTKEQANEFSQLLALLVNALEEKHQDFLGQVYMRLNLGNSANGQFFTPYHVSKLMSKINFAETENLLKNKSFITLSEPCCGSGGIIIAFAETMKDSGYNYQNQLYVEAIDIDELCFMMTYLQLSLYGIPARVIHGDTISYRYQQDLLTPFYFINGFSWRLKEIEQSETKSQQEIIKKAVEMKQLSLF